MVESVEKEQVAKEIKAGEKKADEKEKRGGEHGVKVPKGTRVSFPFRFMSSMPNFV